VALAGIFVRAGSCGDGRAANVTWFHHARSRPYVPRDAGSGPAVEEYLGAQPRAEARQRLQRIRDAGFDQIKFAWMGGLEKGQGHYYRVQGSTFLIDYDNTQDDANHIHCVWRDSTAIGVPTY
jgi:hypothetical protein